MDVLYEGDMDTHEGDTPARRHTIFEHQGRRPFQCSLERLGDGRWEWRIFVWIGEYATVDFDFADTESEARVAMTDAFTVLRLNATLATSL